MDFNTICKRYETFQNYVKRNEAEELNPVLTKNKKFFNIHKGDRCFILGSGHSVLKQDLTKLKGQIVMTQNHFHVHPDIDIIKPKYHCVVPKYQFGEHDKNWTEWFASMEEKLGEDCIYFHGLRTKSFIDENKFFEGNSYYISSDLDPMFMDKAQIDITKSIMHINTVITQCITIALYMGFEEILLIGFDLDQTNYSTDNIRFYKESPVTANSAEKNEETRLSKTAEGWFARWLIFEQLVILANYAEANNQKIINLAPGGMLNCYERKNYEEYMESLNNLKPVCQ